ncbi:DUF134 domain-containing protein [Edwardsiella anguillarum]|nr:DUF134 domain-containing protein [Edwardsiella anguillarum]
MNPLMRYGSPWLALLLLLPARAAPTPSQTVTIGVLATRGTQMAERQWQPLADWLSQRLPAYRFRLQPYDISALDSAVRQRRLDFVITNPGRRSRWDGTPALLAGDPEEPAAPRQYQRHRICADRAQRQPPASPGRSARQKYQRRLAQAFGGYQTLLYRLAREGYDYRRFFAQTRFAGFPLDALIYRLRDGETDAAIVPVCQLEQVTLARDEFEALRLVDREGLQQQQAAAEMGVSRQTLVNILNIAPLQDEPLGFAVPMLCMF